MAITTVDQLIAGFQPLRYFSKAATPTLIAGKPQSTWALGGIPGAGAFDGTLNGVTLSSTSALVNGQIPFYDPGAGNSYLARFVGYAGVAGVLLLCDRLWHNGGYTGSSTSAQNSTTPTWPARDNAGATAGDGVLLGLEVETAGSTNAPTITVTYTNSGGTGSRTGAFGVATTATAAAGSFFPITLQAGDTGVKSLETIQLSASWGTAVIHMVAYRVIAALELPFGGLPNAVDALTSGMPRMFNGSVPFLAVIPTNTTASAIGGAMTVTQG